MGKTPTPDEILAARAKAGNIKQPRQKYWQLNPTASKTAIDSAKYLAEAAEKALQPSFLRKYGPITALTAAGTGFFDAPEQDDLETPPTGQELIDKDPTKYLVQNIGPRTANPPFLVPTRFPLRHKFNLLCNLQQQVVKQAAQTSFHGATVV